MAWTKKQMQYLDEATHRWNIKCGATRAGKTYLDYYVIPKRIKRVRGLDGLIIILGNTKGTLQRNVIEPMQAIYGAGMVGDIRSDNTSFMFGEKVHCLGADNKKHVDRLRGSGAKYIYGDEVVSWNEEVFEMVKSRLDKDYSKFDGTCNPGSPQHWLKKFIDSDADIFYQQYSIYDNDFLSEKVRSEMEKEHTGVFYQRYILGEWTLAEGLVYPTYTTVKPEELPTRFSRYYISCDYGTSNPCVFLLWGQHGRKYYLIKEYYYDGRMNPPRTDSQHCAALVEFAGNLPIDTVYIDPSAASFILEVNNNTRLAVRKADNDVLNGIRETGKLLANGTILISESCTNLINELGLYSWNPDSNNDEPIKENDHACDGLRYFVRSERLAY
jgi:PBSX family phage terminase large subunit